MSDRIDMDFVQSQFPALGRDWVFMDNAGGSQCLRGVVDRISTFLLEKNVQIGGSYAVSQAAADALAQSREAMRLFMNAGRAEEIVFGPTTTSLAQTLATTMRSQLSPGDEIIVTVADHESNIGPWMRLREFGVVVKIWELNRETWTMALDDLGALMTDRTRLVAMHHVSNILGRINPIADIATYVHERGARICVDGVAYAPHRAIDVTGWDVDYYIFSLYKAYGPHLAVMYGKYDHLLELDGLYHYFYGKDRVPGKLEPGNPNYELAYGASAIPDYLGELGRRQGAPGDGRSMLEAGFSAAAAQEDALTDRLLGWLATRGDARVIGPGRTNDGSRVPTVAFRLDGMNSGDVARAMDDHGIAIRFGDFHSRRLVEHLGEDHDGGVVRASLVHYNTIDQVDRLTAALERIADRAA